MNECLVGSDMNAVEIWQSKEIGKLETAGLPSDGALGACAWTIRVKVRACRKAGTYSVAKQSYASGIRIGCGCPKSRCHTHPRVYLVAAFAECPTLAPPLTD
jgi:hypothetical protein